MVVNSWHKPRLSGNENEKMENGNVEAGEHKYKIEDMQYKDKWRQAYVLP